MMDIGSRVGLLLDREFLDEVLGHQRRAVADGDDLSAAPLDVVEVTRRVSNSNNWIGAYFECLVRRGA